MAHEQRTPRCSTGGGSLSKKLEKKASRRGMGVAQLEKILFEERQQKNAVAILAPAILSNLWPPSIPLPPPLPPYHQPLIHRTDDATNHVLLSKPMHMSTSGGGHNWSRFRTGGENDFQRESQNQNQDQRLQLHHRGYAGIVPTNLGGLPYESNPSVWLPQPNSTQRSQLFQQVNVPLGTTSSSDMSFLIEPPSIQVYRGSHHQPSWPEEDKMVGMKRSCPFSIEPIPSSNCKFPFASILRSDGSTSCNNGRTTTFDPPNHVSR